MSQRDGEVVAAPVVTRQHVGGRVHGQAVDDLRFRVAGRTPPSQTKRKYTWSVREGMLLFLLFFVRAIAAWDLQLGRACERYTIVYIFFRREL